nr:hypothetical protein CFP56_58738 [Quercus suber]
MSWKTGWPQVVSTVVPQRWTMERSSEIEAGDGVVYNGYRRGGQSTNAVMFGDESDPRCSLEVTVIE